MNRLSIRAPSTQPPGSKQVSFDAYDHIREVGDPIAWKQAKRKSKASVPKHTHGYIRSAVPNHLRRPLNAPRRETPPRPIQAGPLPPLVVPPTNGDYNNVDKALDNIIAAIDEQEKALKTVDAVASNLTQNHRSHLPSDKRSNPARARIEAAGADSNALDGLYRRLGAATTKQEFAAALGVELPVHRHGSKVRAAEWARVQDQRRANPTSSLGGDHSI